MPFPCDKLIFRKTINDTIRSAEELIMVRFTVHFNSITDVKDFVHIVNSFPYDVDLSSGRYVVDAKSIMGIFSLELQRPISIEIHSDTCDDLVKSLEPYRIKD